MGWENGDDPVIGDPVESGRPTFAETRGGAVTGITRRPAQDWGADDAELGPPTSAKVGAFGQGAIGGAIEITPAVAGAVAGAKLGSLAGPWGAAGGTVLGGLSGLLAGRTLREHAARVPFGDSTLTTPSVEDMRPELRPYGFAGEVVGGGTPIAALPLQAARAGVQPASSLVRKVVESAGRNPGSFAAAEGASLASAGAAGAVAENYLPGQPYPRMGAEIVGGLLNPANLVMATTQRALDTTRSLASQLYRPARENRAAAILQHITTTTGEDPATLARQLRENFPVAVTSAQKTGSPALIALEARLANESAKFGAESRRTAEEGLSSIKSMIASLEGTGQPEALKAAAEVRAQYFRTLLAGLVQEAEGRAIATASQITKDSPQTRAVLSQWANGAVESALRDARKVERELWSKIPREVPAAAENIIERHARIRDQLLPEEPLPVIVEGFVSRIAQADNAVSSGELLRFRSRMLDLAREAAGKGEANNARIYGEFAEAALDDLSAVADRTPGLNEARQFSRELNDTFTRTFAGDTLATKTTGADRIPPELVMRRALGEGKEAGALRFKQLQDAIKFLPEKGLGGPQAEQNMKQMLDVQERILRLAAAEAVNPPGTMREGRVSAIRLARFMESNSELMDRFPEVGKQLRAAISSETNLQNLERIASGAEKAIEKKAAFARVAKYDSPADAIRSALSTPTPQQDFAAIAKLAKRGGAEAVEGMRVSVWDDAIRRSSTDTGGLSFTRLQANLFNPVRPGQPSLAQMMQHHGLMSAADIQRADELIKRALTVEKAIQRGGSTWEPLVGNTDGVFDLVARIAGAKLGTSVGQLGGEATSGHQLIAASAGSRYMRQVLEKIPQGKVKDVLIEAAMNPEFAATLLEKPRSAAQGARIARRAHAYLFQAGLLGQDDNQ